MLNITSHQGNKCELKPPGDTTSHVRMAINKRTKDNKRVLVKLEKLEPLLTADRNVKWWEAV
jgi:hypothetical protein